MRTSTIATLLPINSFTRLETHITLISGNGDTTAYLQNIFAISNPVRILKAVKVEVGTRLKDFMRILRLCQSTHESPPRESLFPDRLSIANPNKDNIQGLFKYHVHRINRPKLYPTLFYQNETTVNSKTKKANTANFLTFEFIFKHEAHLPRFIETAVEMKHKHVEACRYCCAARDRAPPGIDQPNGLRWSTRMQSDGCICPHCSIIYYDICNLFLFYFILFVDGSNSRLLLIFLLRLKLYFPLNFCTYRCIPLILHRYQVQKTKS